MDALFNGMIIGGVLLFMAGVIACWLFFLVTNRGDKANKKFPVLIAEEFKKMKERENVLSARISALENAKHPKVYSIETMDRVTKLEADFRLMNRNLNRLRGYSIRLREYVSQLTPFHIYAHKHIENLSKKQVRGS